MASLSRILNRSFCTSLSKTKPAAAAPTQPFKGLIDDLFKERNLNKLVEKFKKSSESYRFRSKTGIYDFTIRRLASAKRFKSIEEILEAQKNYKDIENEGFAIRLIKLYGRSGMFDHASKLFDQMPDLNCKRTVKSYNALLNACLDSKNYDKVVEMFNEFKSNDSIKPDIYTYNNVIKAMCEKKSFDSAVSMLKEMEKSDVKPNHITYNMLLYGLYGDGKFSEAEKIWKKMEKNEIIPDVRSYNAKLSGLVVKKKVDEAVKLIEEMKTKDVKPDVFSFNYLIKGYCENNEYTEKAMKIFDELAEKNSCAPNRQTYSILIEHLCQKEDFDLAHKMCKDSMSHRFFVPLELVQKVVDGLIKESKVEEAEKLVELAKSNSYGKANLKLATDKE